MQRIEVENFFVSCYEFNVRVDTYKHMHSIKHSYTVSLTHKLIQQSSACWTGIMEFKCLDSSKWSERTRASLRLALQRHANDATIGK